MLLVYAPIFQLQWSAGPICAYFWWAPIIRYELIFQEIQYRAILMLVFYNTMLLNNLEKIRDEQLSVQNKLFHDIYCIIPFPWRYNFPNNAFTEFILKASLCNNYQNFNIHTLRCDFLYIYDEQVHRLASSPLLFLRPGYPCFLYEYSDFPLDGQECFSA